MILWEPDTVRESPPTIQILIIYTFTMSVIMPIQTTNICPNDFRAGNIVHSALIYLIRILFQAIRCRPLTLPYDWISPAFSRPTLLVVCPSDGNYGLSGTRS